MAVTCEGNSRKTGLRNGNHGQLWCVLYAETVLKSVVSWYYQWKDLGCLGAKLSGRSSVCGHLFISGVRLEILETVTVLKSVRGKTALRDSGTYGYVINRG